MAENRHTPEELEYEKGLVVAAQADISAFGPLYESYFQAIFRYCVIRTADRSKAEEICSQVFLNAMENLHKYRWQGAPFGAWLYRIAGNLIKNHYRDHKPLIELDKMENQLGTDTDALFDRLEDAERYDLARLLLEKLEAPCQTLVSLRFYEMMSYTLIAKQVRKSEAACKMALKRCLGKMKAALPTS